MSVDRPTSISKVEGWIEKLYINATGDTVKQGQPVAEIYSLELLATRQEFTNVLRWKKSLKGGGIGDLWARTPRLSWGRPDSGSVFGISPRPRSGGSKRPDSRSGPDPLQPGQRSGYATMAVRGMKVMPGEKLFEVVDLSSVWVVGIFTRVNSP